MKQLFNKYLEGDKVIWVISIILMILSIVSVYSFVEILVKTEGGSPFGYLMKHSFYVGLTFGVMYWIHKRDVNVFGKISKGLFYLSIILMVFTMFFGIEINNASRWIRVPFVGLTFQSSDFAKIALLLYMSVLLEKKQRLLDDWKKGFWPVVAPLLIIFGLTIKDNFSTAAIILSVGSMLLFIGNVPLKKLFTVLSGFIVLFSIVILIHKSFPEANLIPRLETWENRIFNKISDEKDILANAQALNAELAIYNGRPTWRNLGLIGQGPGKGELKEFLPEAYADFYYASFVEEIGTFWAFVLILLYIILFYRILQTGIKAKRLYQTYFCIGFGILLMIQASVNMLVCTGVFPVTGQNMPLLAMGGSAMLFTGIGIGMVQAIARQSKNKSKRKIYQTE